MKYKFLLFLSFIGMLGSGCNLINPAEKVPTYIHVDSFSFNITDPSREGTARQQINTAWVFFNNKTVGVFELPVTIPILADGPGQVQMIPGVTVSGLKDYVTQYAFFKSATTDIALSPGNIIQYTPQTSYVTDAVFQWKEDFETGNTFIPVNAESTTDSTIIRVTDKNMVYEGAAAGYIYMDASHYESENISNNSFPISQGRSFLEIHYKGNTSFQVGLQTTVSGSIDYEYIIGLKAKDTWNKVYVDLSQFTSERKGNAYRIMIKSGLDEGLTSGYVLLDNLKIISF
jgi:hypothetical protein